MTLDRQNRFGDRADDDFGVAQFELVYAVRGGAEKAIPFDKAGWVTPYARAAALNDFVSATACA